MRLLVEVGYTKVLFGKGAPVAEIIAAFEGCKIVKEESGWQQPKRYLVESDAEIGVTLINEDAISLPDVVDNGGLFEKFAALSKERDAAVERARVAEKRIKEIEGAVAAKGGAT